MPGKLHDGDYLYFSIIKIALKAGISIRSMCISKIYNCMRSHISGLATRSSAPAAQSQRWTSATLSENWGMIVFSEKGLLYDARNAPPSSRQVGTRAFWLALQGLYAVRCKKRAQNVTKVWFCLLRSKYMC